jgi:hypothetical protein
MADYRQDDRTFTLKIGFIETPTGVSAKLRAKERRVFVGLSCYRVAEGVVTRVSHSYAMPARWTSDATASRSSATYLEWPLLRPANRKSVQRAAQRHRAHVSFTPKSGHRPLVHFQLATGGTFWVATEARVKRNVLGPQVTSQSIDCEFQKRAGIRCHVGFEREPAQIGERTITFREKHPV